MVCHCSAVDSSIRVKVPVLLTVSVILLISH